MGEGKIFGLPKKEDAGLTRAEENKENRFKDRKNNAYKEHVKVLAEKCKIPVEDLNDMLSDNEILRTSVLEAAESEALSLEQSIRERWKTRNANRQAEAADGEAEKFGKIARIDELTQIYNRRGLMMDIEQRQNDLDFQKTPGGNKRKEAPKKFWIFWIDFDNFKNINDNYGHDAGDEALISVANLIRENLRPHKDVVARPGGDEFAAVIEDDGNVDIPGIADRLREIIENSDIEYKGRRLPVTVTIGASPYLEDGADKMMKIADNALYAAKGKKDKVEEEGLEIEGEIPSGDDVKNQVWYFDEEIKKYKKYNATKKID